MDVNEACGRLLTAVTADTAGAVDKEVVLFKFKLGAVADPAPRLNPVLEAAVEPPKLKPLAVVVVVPKLNDVAEVGAVLVKPKFVEAVLAGVPKVNPAFVAVAVVVVGADPPIPKPLLCKHVNLGKKILFTKNKCLIYLQQEMTQQM